MQTAALAQASPAVDRTDSAFITIPATTLPGGRQVPAFQVARYAASRGADGLATVDADLPPWVRLNYAEARAAAIAAGAQLITESQCLAIALDIAAQDINWTGGKVGEGDLFQGLRDWSVLSAQPGSFEPADASQRTWHQLGSGERIYHFAGNAFTWVFDDVQGDEDGLTTTIRADSPSLNAAPFPSMEKGMGWRPDGERDWTGDALIRGGYWDSEAYAGVFHLGDDWPERRLDLVGFRCTKPIGR